MTDHIPLNKLILSPRNVRKTNGEEDIESLADSIHSKGLLQNLVVSPAAGPSGKAQKFAVDAGGRRLRALQHNLKLGRIPANQPVPCITIASDDGLEASLAENLQKIAMNPADEVEAFDAIVNQPGAGTDSRDNISDNQTRLANCARRFGRTENYVRQRLALAALSPEILDALRDGKITIAAARAYAGHPDHKVQLKVFNAEEKKTETWHHPHDAKTVKDTLDGKIYPPDHHLVKYVGLDAYAAAGGRLETDLFFGEGEREILLDPAIIDKLAKDQAGKQAMAQAQQDGWAGGVIAPLHSDWANPKTPKGYREKWTSNLDSIPTDQRSTQAISYRLSTKTAELVPITNRTYVAEEPATEADAANNSSQMQAPRDWQAERRRETIELRAAQLAAPSLQGTPLEGRALWPKDEYGTLEIIEKKDGSKYAYIELLVEVPMADLETHRAAAEQQLDQEEAVRAKIEERIEYLREQGLNEAADELAAKLDTDEIYHNGEIDPDETSDEGPDNDGDDGPDNDKSDSPTIDPNVNDRAEETAKVREAA